LKNHHQDPKPILNRISRAIGHLEHIKTMINDEKDCAEILTQVAAVKAAVNSIGNQILKDHISYCVLDESSTCNNNRINELATAIDRYLK